MQPGNFKLLIDALTEIAIFWGGYWAALKAVKEYFQTRVAEADKQSHAHMISNILKDIADIRELQQKGMMNEREVRLLVDRLIEDLRFIMQQLIDSALPKRNIKPHTED